LSIRLPPGVVGQKAVQSLKTVLEKDPPYGAKVTFTVGDPADGWASPILAEWLEKSVNSASLTYFKKNCVPRQTTAKQAESYLDFSLKKSQTI